MNFISCNSQNYEFETILIETSYKKATKFGVDLKSEFERFENYLIEEQVLKDNNGDSYYRIYEILEKAGDINLEFEYSFIDSIVSKKNNFDPYEVYDYLRITKELENSEIYKESKIYNIKLKLDSLVSTNESTTITSIAKIYTDILNPTDFKHDYYKYSTLLLLDRLNQPTGIDDNFNIKEDDYKIKYPDDALLIKLNEGKEILISDSIIDINDLKRNLNKYFSKDKETYEVVIDVSRETNYSFYLEVQKIINYLIDKNKNKFSSTKYRLEFENLPDEQKDIVLKRYPNLIEIQNQ